MARGFRRAGSVVQRVLTRGRCVLRACTLEESRARFSVAERHVETRASVAIGAEAECAAAFSRSEARALSRNGPVDISDGRGPQDARFVEVALRLFIVKFLVRRGESKLSGRPDATR